MSWVAPVFSTAKTGTPNSVTSDAVDSSGCEFLIVSVSWYPAVTANPTFSDSKGNSWTALTSVGGGTGVAHRHWVCYAPTSVGTGHTFTLSGTDTYAGLQAMGFAGAAVSPVNGANTNSGTTVSTLTTGSVTPSVNECLLVASVGHGDNASGARSINSSFTIGATNNFSGGNGYGGSIAYLIQTTSAAANPTWDITGAATEVRAALSAFELSSGGGSSSVPPPFPRFNYAILNH